MPDWFHAAPLDISNEGIIAGKRSTVNNRGMVSPYVYLGSWDYIFLHYFQYAPRRIYWIYRVETEGLTLEPLPGEQVRVLGNISANCISLIQQVNTRKKNPARLEFNSRACRTPVV